MGGKKLMKNKIVCIIIVFFIILLTLGIPANADQPPFHQPENIGDIIVAECTGAKVESGTWDHALLYIGGSGEDCIESDPHVENFPQITGEVEYTDINETCSDYNVGQAQGEVTSATQGDRDDAVDFAGDRIGRPFDYTSYVLNLKQEDGSWGTAGYRYYCSELVWAAYKSVDIDLDPGTGRVTPLELITSDDVDKYWQWGDYE